MLMTSRSLNVLEQMGVQRHFLLQVLQHEEAWRLFEEKAGNVRDPNLEPVAIEIARRCGGLPVLIVAVATSLRNKELCEWHDALEELKRIDNEGIEAQVVKALELSYNYLEAEEKSLFLLCGQLRAHNVFIDDLLKYSMGMGLFNQRTTVRASRNRLLKVVNDLKRSCLLLKGDEDDQVKMHDVVHNFAGYVASRDRNVFIVASGTALQEWPEKEKFEQYTAISLPYCQKIPKFPEVFECPNLQSFILYNNDPSLKIPDSFFSKMKKLTLVDITGVHLSPLPSSLQSVANLQTLCLDRCVLEDISAIGALNKLQVLSFSGSNIVRLPSEVGKLTRLQLLDLSRCQRLEVIPPGVLSCLTKLQELHMLNSFVNWEGEEEHDDGARNNASLSELKLLPNLFILDLHVTNSRMLLLNLFSEKLERFRVLIGDEWDWSGNFETLRTLKLMLNSISELERVEVSLKRTEDLYLNDLKGVKCVLLELDREGFPQLKHLHMQNCHQIQYLVDMGGHFISFPGLESLVLDNLNSLEKICYSQIMAGSFSKLKKLKVGNCNVLKSMFSMSIFRGLVLLEEMDVNGCKIMEEIVSEEEDVDGKDEVIELKQLRSLTLEYLPQLKSFYFKVPSISPKIHELPIAGSSSTEITSEVEESETFCLFNKKIIFFSMKELKLSSINMEKLWPDKLQEAASSIIQNLTSLIVEGCGNLNYLFMSSMVKGLAQLKKLEIGNCNLIEELIVAEQGLEELTRKRNILIPKLEFLKLKGLPMLIRFCTANLLECPSLKVLWLENCPLLETFISSPLTRDVLVNSQTEQGTLFDEKVSFPNLEELLLAHMHKLKMIWQDELREDSFCKLKVLKIKHGNKLTSIFSSELLRRFQNVDKLVVKNCYILEEVFDIQAVLNVHVSVANRLRTLIVKHLPNLKHVWKWKNGDDSCGGIISFDNLRRVEVRGCPSLKSLFPFSIAQGFGQLESLLVDKCGVEELVAIADGTDNPKFVFPRLKDVILWMLNEVRCFYSSQHTLECPLLDRLVVHDCKKMNTFASESQHMEGSVVQPLFSHTKIVKNVTRLGLKSKDIMAMVEGQFPIELFDNLKFLHLDFSDDASENFSIFYNLLRKFKNLKQLYIAPGYFKELVPNGIVVIDDDDAGLLASIQWLRLDLFPNMRHLWNEDCRLLQNLQNLYIWNCDGLINLAPSFASLQNLTTLDVYKCLGLLNLVSVSTAQNMVNLTNLTVRESPVVTEIVADDDRDESQSQSELIFNKLQTLNLHCLKSLTSFCSSPSCIIRFPSLERVVVSQCPKIKVFSQGLLSTPKLKRVHVTQETDHWRWIGDLNTTIKQVFRELVGFVGHDHVKLSEFPQLQKAWLGQLPVNFFYNMTCLVVDECAFPSVSVPSNLLPFLNNLQTLEITNCNAVEQLFGFERPNASGNVGYLSKLNELHLIDLPRLRLLWDDFSQGNFDFKNLKVLKVCNCNGLGYILTSTMCSGLVGLEDLIMKCCEMVEEIITAGFAKEDIKLPPLKSITLESLPRLSNLSSGSGTLQCPSLEEITIVDCPTPFTSSFLGDTEPNATHGIVEPKVNYPNIMDLKLLSVDIENIWHGQVLEVSTSIKNLTSLAVHGCGNLQYILSSSMVKSAVHLRRMELCNCERMKEIIFMDGLEEEMTRKMLLHKLDFLKLKDLPRLAQFCTVDSIECHALKKLWIEDCPALRTFKRSNISAGSEIININSTLFNDKVAFPNLEELQILNMNGVKAIWSSELCEDSFVKLKKLVIRHVKELQNIFSANLVRRFQNLECLHIQGSDALQEVFDLKGLEIRKEANAVVATQLKTLKVYNLPNLKHVWNEDPKGLVEFQNLCLVDATDCPGLKFLFPTSIARSLPDLEQLQIVGCGIEEIVAEEDGIETPLQFEFPKLTSLVLRSLPRLHVFFPGRHTINWPILKTLRVFQCDRIQIFASEIQSFQEQGREEQIHVQTEQPLLSFTKIICNLEELAFNSKDVAMICQDQFPEDFFHNIKVLELNCFDNNSAIFPFDLLLRFPNLEKLILLHSEFKELFPHTQLVGEKNHERTLAKLQSLQLDKLHNLKYIWHPDSQLDKVLQTLETLEVWNCDSLVNLKMPLASLKNLTNLDVVNCKGLVNLMTYSTAKCLVNLRRLSIKECYMMREVVSNLDEGDTSDEIIFVQLESLELHCLPSLTSFCSGGLNFKFPWLTEVIASQCPKLQDFSKGAVRTDILQRILLKKERDGGCWNGNLNSTIKLVHRNGCISRQPGAELSVL